MKLISFDLDNEDHWLLASSGKAIIFVCPDTSVLKYGHLQLNKIGNDGYETASIIVSNKNDKSDDKPTEYSTWGVLFDVVK